MQTASRGGWARGNQKNDSRRARAVAHQRLPNFFSHQGNVFLDLCGSIIYILHSPSGLVMISCPLWMATHRHIWAGQPHAYGQEDPRDIWAGQPPRTYVWAWQPAETYMGWATPGTSSFCLPSLMVPPHAAKPHVATQPDGSPIAGALELDGVAFVTAQCRKLPQTQAMFFRHES